MIYLSGGYEYDLASGHVDSLRNLHNNAADVVDFATNSVRVVGIAKVVCCLSVPAEDWVSPFDHGRSVILRRVCLFVETDFPGFLGDSFGYHRRFFRP